MLYNYIHFYLLMKIQRSVHNFMIIKNNKIIIIIIIIITIILYINSFYNFIISSFIL